MPFKTYIISKLKYNSWVSIFLLYSRCAETCNKFSEDVTLWAQYKIGIKIFSPWLSKSEEVMTMYFKTS